MTPDKVITNFSRCKTWEEKYLYLIELGERYATLTPEQCVAENRVSGCQSQVWVTISIDKQQLNINATSDASIVRGLLGLLIIAYKNKSIQEATNFDIHKWFIKLELKDHLTPTRTIGLNAIIKNVQAQNEQLQ